MNEWCFSWSRRKYFCPNFWQQCMCPRRRHDWLTTRGCWGASSVSSGRCRTYLKEVRKIYNCRLLKSDFLDEDSLQFSLKSSGINPQSFKELYLWVPKHWFTEEAKLNGRKNILHKTFVKETGKAFNNAFKKINLSSYLKTAFLAFRWRNWLKGHSEGIRSWLSVVWKGNTVFNMLFLMFKNLNKR